MKKIMILCLAAMLLLVGCNSQTTPEPEAQDTTVTNPEQTSDGAETTLPPETHLKGFGYAEGTLTSVIVTDIARGISADMSANGALKAGLLSIKYDPDQRKAEAGTAVYELKLDGKSMYVYAQNVAAYDGSDLYPCNSFDLLTYLEGLFVGDVTPLGGYAADAVVKLQNSSGKVAEVSDNAEFFTKLGNVKVIKLARAADYTVPPVEYTVKIGEESIAVCGNYLKTGAELYAVVEGNFAFFAEYSFSSSSDGFLPWI